jgi:hypothetical protein
VASTDTNGAPPSSASAALGKAIANARVTAAVLCFTVLLLVRGLGGVIGTGPEGL